MGEIVRTNARKEEGTRKGVDLTSGAVMSMLKLNADIIKKNWLNAVTKRNIDAHKYPA